MILWQYLIFLFSAFFLLRPYFFPVVKIEEVSYLKNLLASAFQRLSWSDPPLSSLLNLCSCWIFFSSYKQALVSTINKIKRKRKKLSWFFNPPDSLTFPCSSKGSCFLHCLLIFTDLQFPLTSAHFNLVFSLTTPLKLIVSRLLITCMLSNPVAISHSATYKKKQKYLSTSYFLKAFLLRVSLYHLLWTDHLCPPKINMLSLNLQCILRCSF